MHWRVFQKSCALLISSLWLFLSGGNLASIDIYLFIMLRIAEAQEEEELVILKFDLSLTPSVLYFSHLFRRLPIRLICVVLGKTTVWRQRFTRTCRRPASRGPSPTPRWWWRGGASRNWRNACRSSWAATGGRTQVCGASNEPFLSKPRTSSAKLISVVQSLIHLDFWFDLFRTCKTVTIRPATSVPPHPSRHIRPATSIPDILIRPTRQGWLWHWRSN